MLLDGVGAVVTGGGGRIGSAIIRVLLREGARVVALDVGEAGSKLIAFESASYMGRIQCDVSRAESVDDAIEEAFRVLDSVGVLVNAHGIFPNTPLLQVSVEEWDSVFGVNARGTMLAARAVARRWIEAGQPGSIVNLSSGASKSVRRGGGHYSGSKAAVDVLTQVMAVEWGGHGIRVNAVAPGLVVEPERAVGDGTVPYYAASLEATPLGRLGRPEDVAEAVAFLASSRAAWISGAYLNVSGGSHCGRTHLDYTGSLR